METDPAIAHINMNTDPLLQELATVHHTQSNFEALAEASASEQEESARKTSIRDRFRKWEEENQSLGELILNDVSGDGNLSNSLTRPQNVTTVQIDAEDSSPVFAGDELVDLRSDDAMLDPGDMVELSCVFYPPPSAPRGWPLLIQYIVLKAQGGLLSLSVSAVSMDMSIFTQSVGNGFRPWALGPYLSSTISQHRRS